MGQLFCYLVYCTIDPRRSYKMKIGENEDQRQEAKAELHLFIKQPQASPSMKCCVRIRCRNINRTTKIFDRTTTNRDQAKPTTLIPSCTIKIQLKNYPQGNISSLESSLKTNLWRKFPIQICKGQGATKKLLKPRCGSIELNIRAGF